MKNMSYILVAVLLLFGCAHKEKKKAESHVPVLTDAYIYGFPLVLMDLTREEMTNVATPDKKGHAPINQFAHVRKFPDQNFKETVRPNLDTLYSSAWIDLSGGAQVLEVPNTKERYYLMPMMDGWTDVYTSPGKRTTGTLNRKFVIVGPKWTGNIPQGTDLIRSPTEMTWIVVRIQTNGAKDIKKVASLQNNFKLYPLESYGKRYVASHGSFDKTITMNPSIEKIFAMSTEDYFNRLNKLMMSNPPKAEDQRALGRFAKVGVAPGATFSIDAFEASERSSINNIPTLTRSNMENNIDRIGKESNGWIMPMSDVGNYGTDYQLRANVAYAGLGTNLAADAIYPMATRDGNGNKLNGNRNYILHFDRAQIPPVNAFWSLTAYGEDNFLIKNSLKRYSLGSRSKLKYNSDGSLDIYLQSISPGESRKSNWLPISQNDFSVTARLYWPAQELLDQNYTLPAIMPVSTLVPVSLNQK